MQCEWSDNELPVPGMQRESAACELSPRAYDPHALARPNEILGDIRPAQIHATQRGPQGACVVFGLTIRVLEIIRYNLVVAGARSLWEYVGMASRCSINSWGIAARVAWANLFARGERPHRQAGACPCHPVLERFYRAARSPSHTAG